MKSNFSPALLAAALVATVNFTAMAADSPSGTQQAADTAPPSAPATAPERDGVAKHEGVVFFIKNGERQRVESELRLSEGIVARSSGQITLKDGRNVDLKEGDLVTLEGEVIPGNSAAAPSGGIIRTTTDRPTSGTLLPVETSGQSSTTQRSDASPTGAARNMAPTRENTPLPATAPGDASSSASGLTAPGAASGSSLGAGSNSALKSDAPPTPATPPKGLTEPDKPGVPDKAD